MGFLKEFKQKLKPPKPDPRDIISADDDEFESISVMSSTSLTSLNDDAIPDEIKSLPYYHGFLPRQHAEDMVMKVC
uniref:Uncharacterized protein n=1 Tax=Parascaris univalens TaxID=6257 RepID=A0A915A3T7_PARUN